MQKKFIECLDPGKVIEGGTVCDIFSLNCEYVKINMKFIFFDKRDAVI